MRIIAGSPSRGSIAVEDVPAPPAGSRIEVRRELWILGSVSFISQFYYRLRSSPVRLPSDILESGKTASGSVIGALVDTPENYAANFMCQYDAEDTANNLFPNEYSGFVVSTEHGFLRAAGSSSSVWKCTVPGAFGGFKVM